MQHEISNTVRLFIRTPPDLFVGQTLKAAFDLGQIVVEQELKRTGNESF
jgi:hypothetical protein